MSALVARFGPPLAALAALIAVWEAGVRLGGVAPYVLPAPSLVLATLIADWSVLSASLWVTLEITFAALALALVGGVGLALLIDGARWLGRGLLPIAVILQVTPVVAIAPILLVWLSPSSAVLVCAFLVAFFPILSNTAMGLASTDKSLLEMFRLYGAGRWRTLWLLRLPAALPDFLGGLRIGGGLALIGAIVGELAAGAAGQGSGLAFRISEAGYRANVPRMFAALLLISLTGLAMHAATSLVSHLALRRWHDSAVARDA